MTKEQIYSIIKDSVLANKDEIIAVSDTLVSKPEYGFKEIFATDYLANKLEELGLNVERNIAITGVRAFANINKKGPKVAIMGEIDAVPCPTHVNSDKVTGASHSCGHSIQAAIMYGVALVLTKTGLLEQLDGKVDFFGLPAEEFIELEYRSQLVKEGKLKYFGGKPELISRGAFDDVDMAFISHVTSIGSKKMHVKASCVGFMVKKIKYIGKASHAGGAPHLGINALNAANIALNAIHNLRETFKDDDHIRVHPIITKGGTGVNSVPDDVRIETYIRGATLEAILDANKKVNRALLAGALAVGAKVEIEDIPGYLPYSGDDFLENIFIDSVKHFISDDDILSGSGYTFSQDIGDVCHILPTVNYFMGGIKGNLHMQDFEVIDVETSFLLPVMVTACTVVELLYNKAEKANLVIKNFKPKLTKTEYLNLLDSLITKRTVDVSEIVSKSL